MCVQHNKEHALVRLTQILDILRNARLQITNGEYTANLQPIKSGTSYTIKIHTRRPEISLMRNLVHYFSHDFAANEQAQHTDNSSLQNKKVMRGVVTEQQSPSGCTTRRLRKLSRRVMAARKGQYAMVCRCPRKSWHGGSESPIPHG